MTRIILFMVIVKRQEQQLLTSTSAWALVYGRRKTGKTYLIKQFVPWDRYFFVKRDRTILDEQGTSLHYDAFLEVVKSIKELKKTIVIDEFHRLPEGFLDYLHFLSPDRQGRIILISSTLYLAKKFFSSGSPLLGLFIEIPLSICSIKETLAALPAMPSKDKLETAMLLREPLALQLLQEGISGKKIITDCLQFSQKAIPALIGEIFSEEERTLSTIYEGILRAVASGKIISGEIASYLFARQLIFKDDPSLIQQHLTTLVKLGILKKIKVYNNPKFTYKHVSPLVKLFYFTDEKYNSTERTLSARNLQEIVQEALPHLIEDTVREFFALEYGLIEMVAEGKDFEVDGLLIKFKKPEIALEVKWKEQLSLEDIKKTMKNLSTFAVKRKILFVPDKRNIKSPRDLAGIEVMDVSDLIQLSS